MMATVAARELADGEVVFVGIGLPNLACNLARVTHAPNLVLIYESGEVGAVPVRLAQAGAAATVALAGRVGQRVDAEVAVFLQRHTDEAGLLGGARVGRYRRPEDR